MMSQTNNLLDKKLIYNQAKSFDFWSELCWKFVNWMTLISMLYNTYIILNRLMLRKVGVLLTRVNLKI
jgi:hypothetical protein